MRARAGWLGAARARGRVRVTSLGGSRRTVAYSRRSVRPGYMLTTPAVGRGWQRDVAGGTPGVAAPAGPGPEERPHWW